MEAEVSHAEIYRELGILQGKMDTLILSRTKDDQERSDLFRRVGALENRMAQVIILAVVAGLVLPAVVGWFVDFLALARQPHAPAQIERQR
jgi:F0F1-type ATP synthase assembly protein I